MHLMPLTRCCKKYGVCLEWSEYIIDCIEGTESALIEAKNTLNSAPKSMWTFTVVFITDDEHTILL